MLNRGTNGSLKLIIVEFILLPLFHTSKEYLILQVISLTTNGFNFIDDKSFTAQFKGVPFGGIIVTGE
jgi:hypothetical protein